MTNEPPPDLVIPEAPDLPPPGVTAREFEASVRDCLNRTSDRIRELFRSLRGQR